MKRILLTSTILTGALAATAATAQQTYDLGTLVLSSSLTPVELGRTGATVEVLDGDDAGALDTSVLGRLDRLPGVSSISNGGLGNLGTIQIRGLPARYVGVRINGIDVADPSNTQNQFNFGGLTASGVGRIEVLKGSQSALYGSEAIAGVVSITTFVPEELGFSGQAQVEAGAFSTTSGSISSGYRSDRGYVALSYGHINTDGISARSSDTEDDGFEQTTADMTAAYDVTDTLTIGGALHYRDGEIEIDRSTSNSSGINYYTEQGARVYATLQTGAVTHTLSYSYFDIDRDDPNGFTTTFTGERHNIGYLGSAELGAATVLTFGIDHTEEKFTSGTARGDEDDTSLKTELLVAATDQIDVSAALRYDDDSSFGGKTTGRLAAVWRPVQDLAFRAVVGTGYRAPSLYERFGPFGLATLQPEESRSYELGVEKTFGTLGFAKATIFYNEIDDLIQFAGSSYNQVSGTTKSKGLELSGEYALTTAISAFGAYTFTDATTDGARLVRTPKHDLVVGLQGDFGDRWSAYVDVRRVADVKPSSFAPAGNKVGDYTLVGAGVSYDVSPNAEIYLRVENLTDEDYETAGGFNQPGRAAYLGLRASF
ncbi:TonB-dependent receptor plug domain-containing protein [Roseovarius arcticus]|uniref:TonB-dependent receptor plug domain-containing protein n=1 Tax=Roseovarius arcticus TaxID=2547404 RepID=UPI0011109F2C|nr:TonB-dependent receptor [Roseovarius arcticus]